MTTENHPAEPRLLPWSSPEGKPSYLLSDGEGVVTDLADSIESVQLGVGAEMLQHARLMLGAEKPPEPVELRFIAARLAEALHDALRVAASRGMRLP